VSDTMDRMTKLQKARELAEHLRAWRDDRSMHADALRVTPAPRYDEVFSQGAEWLDALAGEPMRPFEGVLAPNVLMGIERLREALPLPAHHPLTVDQVFDAAIARIKADRPKELCARIEAMQAQEQTYLRTIAHLAARLQEEAK